MQSRGNYFWFELRFYRLLVLFTLCKYWLLLCCSREYPYPPLTMVFWVWTLPPSPPTGNSRLAFSLSFTHFGFWDPQNSWAYGYFLELNTVTQHEIPLFFNFTYCGLFWECTMSDLTSECRYEIICWLLVFPICRQAGCKMVKKSTVSWVVLLLCSFFLTPLSGRGVVIPIFLPAVRTGSSNTRFFFTPPSGRGLVIPLFYPAVRTGSSNTLFF